MVRGRVAASVARLGAVALVAAACSSGGGSGSPRFGAPARGRVNAGASTSAPGGTTTTFGAAGAAPAAVHPPGLIPGDSGPAVLAMEQRLAALHYDVGSPDGHYGPADAFAVTAFEKVNGLPRTGAAPPQVLAAMATATDPAPLVPAGGAFRVEVDLPRQVLFLYEHDALVRILPVSTGSGAHYCEHGVCGVAVTPGGSFRVGTKILGLHISPLGELWNPLFFNGGIAIHGEPAVPPYPASHGCVRIPMNSSPWFFNEVPSGTPVYVVGGPSAPVPLGVPMPPPQPAPPSTTPTTHPPVATTSPPTTSAPPTSAPPPTTTPATTAPPRKVTTTTV